MSNLYICPNGHQWDPIAPSVAEETVAFGVCPVCGETVSIKGELPSPDAGSAERNTDESCGPTQHLSLISLDATQNFSISPVAENDGRTEIAELPVGSTVGNYRILGELGRGGMGLVYRAHDQEHDRQVALKTLKAMDPELLHAFKSEFRTISKVTHPNLVTLYELVSDGESWYITMEIIQGTDFHNFVLRGPAASGDAPPNGYSDDIDRRLRSALKQLAIGLNAIHTADILHRDLKPSNILVTNEGQVKILDFGLVATLEKGKEDSDGRIVGTPAYMSPEQVRGRFSGEATDWYAVGVMLYEVLTRQKPFRGLLVDVLVRKQHEDPPAPRELVEAIPGDLNDLCVGLLQREPAARPSLERFFDIAADELAWTGSAAGDSLLVGREHQLKTLGDCFHTVQNGDATTVFVHGISGFGKSALVETFLDDIDTANSAVVLKGRCYERESVPYKAWDSLVDSLSDYLAGWSEEECKTIVPQDVAPLGRVFPVLKRVSAIANAASRYAEIPDQQELRRRAFGALRQMLNGMARRKPLILYIDDLQWGDVDSAVLLAELLRPPASPPLMFMGCYRSDEASSSPFLRTLEELEQQGEVVTGREVIQVGPLEQDEAIELAAALIGGDGQETQRQAEAVAKEAGGSPFFIAELVRHISIDASALATTGGLVLDEVLWKRVTRCTDDERRLLEVIAVATQPTDPECAYLAAGVVAEGPGLLAKLQSDHFVRTLGSGVELAIESYHDRVRESVVSHLEADVLVNHHLQLGTVLEQSGSADAERLALHFQEAGKDEKAGGYYATAAGQAADALAFGRAAEFYRLSLELKPPQDQSEVQSMRRKLADALANDGRGPEAAEEYLQAAMGEKSTFTIDMQRRAAMQYLFSGHMDRGLATLRWVTGEVGLKMPKSPLRAAIPLLLKRLHVALRGFKFNERTAEEVGEEDLLLIDMCWEAGQGLSIVDPVRASYFLSCGLLLALRAGEPYRISRSLTLEGVGHYALSLTSDKRTIETADRRLGSAEELARRVTEKHAMGTFYLCTGMVTYLQGRWADARDYLYHAEGIFRNYCTGVMWELDTAITFSLWSLTYMGEIAELKRRRQELLREAQERGDLYLFANLSTYIMSLDRLGSDEPDGARDELDGILEQWSQQGFHVQHHNVILAKSLIDMYTDRGEEAWQRITKRWGKYRRSMLLNMAQIRVDVTQSRARSALSAAATSDNPKLWLRRAAKDARRLEREYSPWARAFAQLVRASIAGAKNNRSEAIVRLRSIASTFDKADMKLYAAASRFRLGELTGGDEGDELMRSAEDVCLREQVAHPIKMMRMFAPGFTTNQKPVGEYTRQID